MSFTSTAVPIAADCVGEEWMPGDLHELAGFVATVAMGQSSYAAYLIEQLRPVTAAYVDPDLVAEATVLLTVDETKATPRIGYPRIQRDGFIFESISWLAARQAYGALAVLKDPHVRATVQGLDGMMVEISNGGDEVVRTTIFEDKCTDNPRKSFQGKVMPGFQDRHSNRRNAELISCASTLLKTAGVTEPNVTRMASAVTDRAKRRYRAAFAVSDTSQTARQALFKGFDDLDGLNPDQRLGACFLAQPVMRDWFDELAKRSVAHLAGLKAGMHV